MSLVPFDDRDGTIWLDGAMAPWREAKLHVLSHGLHYASAVFEGERAYEGRIFKLEEHTQRLARSAQLLGFTLPFAEAAISEACRAVVAANGLTEAYVRPVAWRGSEKLSVGGEGTRVHVAVASWAWPNLFGADRMKGVRLGMAPWKRPHPETAPTASKASGLYMIGTLSRQAAEAAGYDDALMLDWRGQVAEATGANIMLVIDGALHTPTPDCFLDGITRRTVMGLARQRGLEVIERAIPLTDLERASEVFLVGTAAEVTPVREIAGRHYAPGAVTEALVRAYDALVRSAPDGTGRLAA